MLIAILGAGASSRFGSNKIAARCAQKPMGQWVVEAAEAIEYPVVWIGGERRPKFLGAGCGFRTNPKRADGLGTSLALAAQEAIERRVARLMILLADMPHITVSLLRELEACRYPTACQHPSGHPGPPAIFPERLFSELSVLSGDRGASAMLRRLPDLVTLTPPSSMLEDVDTPAQLIAA